MLSWRHMPRQFENKSVNRSDLDAAWISERPPRLSWQGCDSRLRPLCSNHLHPIGQPSTVFRFCSPRNSTL